MPHSDRSPRAQRRALSRRMRRAFGEQKAILAARQQHYDRRHAAMKHRFYRLGEHRLRELAARYQKKESD